MSRTTRIAIPLLAVALLSSAPFIAHAQNSFFGSKTVPTSAYTVNVRDLALPGPDRAFQDGMLGARLDTLARRNIAPETSHLYLHPPVRGKGAKGAYRTEFAAGYEAALRRPAS